ncbi:mitochondrial carrier domain-containing protein [Tricharina praecox]|uniref:mitochondrial carrier domain-containing protein n=1 Tax=Tricharina praecox TaxID=43433 RepID=UPI0022211B0C|nr:mitochondrial carrier domain-containing protein [Tricharina praecox]KAI5848285.1 mitochondrial carrier domain-containing protein [Tricharina praecox]
MDYSTAPASSSPASILASPYVRSLIAGGFAGTAVDLSLYPLDTLKTRLQSAGGFFKNGGWSGVYKGVGSVIAGSAPGAALFFVTYEHVKTTLRHGEKTGSSAAVTHMLAASIGEIAACSVRVPTEVIKQRAQASQFASSWQALRHIFTANTSAVMVWKELYRGWGVTIMREIPFTVIQFPLWEAMKEWRGEAKGRKANPAESAVFGSVSGAIAAAATTPLDVLKTRLMLAKQKQSALWTFKNIVAEEGTGALFKGITPRVIWISIGGAIFLGAWDFARGSLESLDRRKSKE